ncbi:DUF805 domain-containing protein [Methylacidiphilum caldifontis]|uniref:DUF805 domain-containing protein n=1 Tax=Methylacidiphilum caldifontis TaxID=2795386 RepID=UPI001A8E1302|nr:DUF805 domain-containing protein [Methylacidiphilum caldifontis]QSR89294.1 DUF805 domain-containing protein [Methylacidiphilum caldifontis]
MEWYLSALRKYTDFFGRARRSEFWCYFLFNNLFLICLRILDQFLYVEYFELGNETPSYGPLSFIYWLATLIPSLAVTVRRLHDTSHSGKWLLIPILLLVGIFISGVAGIEWIVDLILILLLVWVLVFLLLLLRDSTPGDNQYGPNPKGIQNTHEGHYKAKLRSIAISKFIATSFIVSGWIIYAVTAVVSFILNLSIVIKVVGFWGGLIAFMVLPITLIFAPWYAGFAQHNWLPLIVTYGGTILGAGFIAIGHLITNRWEKHLS